MCSSFIHPVSQIFRYIDDKVQQQAFKIVLHLLSNELERHKALQWKNASSPGSQLMLKIRTAETRWLRRNVNETKRMWTIYLKSNDLQKMGIDPASKLGRELLYDEL